MSLLFDESWLAYCNLLCIWNWAQLGLKVKGEFGKREYKMAELQVLKLVLSLFIGISISQCFLYFVLQTVLLFATFVLSSKLMLLFSPFFTSLTLLLTLYFTLYTLRQGLRGCRSDFYITWFTPTLEIVFWALTSQSCEKKCLGSWGVCVCVWWKSRWKFFFSFFSLCFGCEFEWRNTCVTWLYLTVYCAVNINASRK